MAREKKPVHKVQMTEGKRKIIRQLLEEYKIGSAKDIHEALQYPNAMKRWYDNRDIISPMFKFSVSVRKVIYTTNAIEFLSLTYRKLNRQISGSPATQLF